MLTGATHRVEVGARSTTSSSGGKAASPNSAAISSSLPISRASARDAVTADQGRPRPKPPDAPVMNHALAATGALYWRSPATSFTPSGNNITPRQRLTRSIPIDGTIFCLEPAAWLRCVVQRGGHEGVRLWHRSLKQRGSR